MLRFGCAFSATYVAVWLRFFRNISATDVALWLHHKLTGTAKRDTAVCGAAGSKKGSTCYRSILFNFAHARRISKRPGLTTAVSHFACDAHSTTLPRLIKPFTS
ncbi:MAG: hypothetical protein JWO08_686 [Verrucomicrobiaceae bacterium]|nr:hypothetical protein [Verrucomicrobiaceae bacterium]